MNSLLSIARRLKTTKFFDKNLIQNKNNLITNQWFARHLAYYEPKGRPTGRVFERNDGPVLENRLRDLRASGGPTGEVVRNLLIYYCRQSQIDRELDPNLVSRVKELDNELSKTADQLNESINGYLVEFYTKSGDINSALEVKNRLQRGFRLDSFKVFNLAALLAKNGSINEAIDMIRGEVRYYSAADKARGFRDSSENFKKLRQLSINRLLNTLVDKKVDKKLVKEVFQMSVKINNREVNKTIAGPLIRMHLADQDFSSALDEFVFCANTYGINPWSLELMRIFIELNDTKSLDVVVKTCNELFGPYNTALDLSAAYVYNGRLTDAKTTLNRVNRIQQQSVEFICEKFSKDKKFEELKNFIVITHSLNGIDGQQLFQLLIKEYNFSGQSDKAIDVLNIMKENNIEPTEETLKLLQ